MNNTWVRLALLAAFLVGVYVIGRATGFTEGLTVDGIRESMRAAGVVPDDALRRNDAWGAFDAAGSLFVPGPTGTNVNDLRAILVGELPYAGSFKR